MSEETKSGGTTRRRLVEVLGTTAVALPVLGLSACGGESAPEASAPAASAPPPEPMKAKAMDAMEEATDAAEDAAEEMASAAEEAAEDAADAVESAVEEVAEEAQAAAETIATDALPQVDENGPQAMGLGYRHDATTIDTAVQTRYAAGQQCSNCVLFQGGDAEWGGCPLFTGMQVKATGWCSAYAARG